MTYPPGAVEHAMKVQGHQIQELGYEKYLAEQIHERGR
jgi:hypothetical protein